MYKIETFEKIKQWKQSCTFIYVNEEVDGFGVFKVRGIFVMKLMEEKVEMNKRKGNQRIWYVKKVRICKNFLVQTVPTNINGMVA